MNYHFIVGTKRGVTRSILYVWRLDHPFTSHAFGVCPTKGLYNPLIIKRENWKSPICKYEAF